MSVRKCLYVSYVFSPVSILNSQSQTQKQSFYLYVLVGYYPRASRPILASELRFSLQHNQTKILTPVFFPELRSEKVPGQASFVGVLETKLLVHHVKKRRALRPRPVAVGHARRNKEPYGSLTGQNEHSFDALGGGALAEVHEPYFEEPTQSPSRVRFAALSGEYETR